MMNFKLKIQIEKCSSCNRNNTGKRCLVCLKPLCGNCRTKKRFKIYFPKTFVVPAGICKSCKEEFYKIQEIKIYTSFINILPDLSEHIKRFLRNLGIEFG
ncbi:hypothetical protein ES704_03601 [subsurface metagenome]